MEFIVFIGVILVVFFIWIGPSQMSYNRSQKMLIKTELMKNREGFQGDVFLSHWDSSGLEIDNSKKELRIFNQQIEKSFPFAKLVSAEILADELSITKTNRGSQIAGTAIGAVLAGGAGAVIGGLSGSKTTKHGGIQRLVLRIIVDDFDAPKHDILFLNWKGYSGKDTADRHGPFKEAFEKADAWHARLTSIIREASASQTTAGSDISISEELGKLSDLHDKGVLSDEEFSRAKLKILNSPISKT